MLKLLYNYGHYTMVILVEQEPEKHSTRTVGFGERYGAVCVGMALGPDGVK